MWHEEIFSLVFIFVVVDVVAVNSFKTHIFHSNERYLQFGSTQVKHLSVELA